MRTTKLALLVIGAVAFATACLPAPPPPPAGWVQGYLTRDAADVTTISVNGPNATFRSPNTNTDINTRVVYAKTQPGSSQDHTSCASFHTPSGGVAQEGIALRVNTEGGRTRAVTVTKNIWAGATNHYNVHVWDTQRSPVLHQVTGFDMTGSVGGSYNASSATARRMCARVEGNRLTFKVWPANQPEPAWNDPKAARTATLPDRGVYNGKPGVYMGHLQPGAAAYATDMATSYQSTVK